MKKIIPFIIIAILGLLISWNSFKGIKQIDPENNIQFILIKRANYPVLKGLVLHPFHDKNEQEIQDLKLGSKGSIYYKNEEVELPKSKILFIDLNGKFHEIDFSKDYFKGESYLDIDITKIIENTLIKDNT